MDSDSGDRMKEDDLNKISSWKQSKFIDNPRYNKWTKAEKDFAILTEKCSVVDSKGGRILQAVSPKHATWIAKRLNLATKLSNESSGYLYSSVKDYEDHVGYEVSEAFKIGFQMARLKQFS